MKTLLTLLLGLFPFLLFSQVMDTAGISWQVDSLLKVARNLTSQGRFDEGFEINLLAGNLALEKIGKESAPYASACVNRGTMWFFQGNYQEAEKWYLESMAIREKVLGKDHPDYALCLHELAILYYSIGNLEKAEPLILETQTILGKAVGKEHPYFIASLENQANLHWYKASYEKAEALYLEIIALREKISGKENPDYALSTDNLGILYMTIGSYEKAEQLFLETISIRGKILGKRHPDYALALNDLGILYWYLGNYEKAENLFLRSKEIWKKGLGEENPDYIRSMNNLAVLYSDMGNNEKAEFFFLEAKAIWEKTIGKDHPDYASNLTGLAALYSENGLYEKAVSIFQEAKTIVKKTMGDEHPDYARILNNLGLLFFTKGDFNKAESLFLDSRDIWGKALGEWHPDYAESLQNLAIMYVVMDKDEKAEFLFEQLSRLNQTLISKSMHHLSELEMNNYLKKFSVAQNAILSFALTTCNQESRMPQLCYDNTLFYKGFLLNAANRIKLLALSDSTATEQYNLVKSYNRRLAAEYAKPIAERNNLPELEEKANDLEKELARTVAGYGEAMRQVTWQEVQGQLQADEAAIELVHFQHLGKNGKTTDSTFYSALLLRPGWPQPRMVYLCEQRQLEPLLQGADPEAAVQRLYALRGISPAGMGLAPDLYRYLWQPLDSLLEGVKTVYYSPSGLLHRVAFSAIPTGKQGEALSDRYQLFQLFSTRSLVIHPEENAACASAVLFGGIDYSSGWEAPVETDSTGVDPAAIAYVPLSTSLLPQTRSRRGEGWDFLPGTKTEVDRLSGLFTKRRISATIYTDTTATEEHFKALGAGGHSPDIIHIATHGFFFPDPATRRENSFQQEGTSIPLSEHPLMRSGLLLAGANQAWQEGKPFPGREDGILTAYEIAQVNLLGTKLAVLSACETGLGDIQGSEGVMGLQRSFKSAGVDKLIVSLWPVPDKQTAVFMETFYDKWLSQGKGIREAFYQTQQWMRKRYKAPFVWAGFLLVE